MIAHVVEFSAPAEVMETVGMQGFRERVLPVLESQPGFLGNVTLLDRGQDRLLGITFWDTDENGRLAGERLERERTTGVGEMDAQSPPPILYEVLDRR